MKTIEHKEDESKENIIALSVFGIIILIVIGFFTNWYGLVESNPEVQRVNVQSGAAPTLGNISNSKVNIVIFSDFQCPFCKKGEETIKQIYNKYPGQVSLQFMHFPLRQIHPNAVNASLASECAREQNKFWEYHDVLFANNEALDNERLRFYAAGLGMDSEKFNSCFDSRKYEFRVESDFNLGLNVGVTSTPTFFVNGIPVIGAQSFETIDNVVKEELSN